MRQQTWRRGCRVGRGGGRGLGGGSDMLNCHSGVDVSCMFQCFVWNWAEVMSKVGVQPPPRPPGYRGGQPHFPRPGVQRGGAGGQVFFNA